MNAAERVRAFVRDVRDDLATNNGAPAIDRDTTLVFVIGTVLLTLFHYYGKASGLRELGLLDAANAMVPAAWSAHTGMVPYVYWGVASLVIRVVVPLALIATLFRGGPSDFGLRVRGQLPHMPVYIGLYLFMLPFLYWASGQSSFQATYPFYSGAGASWSVFLTYELFYALQFAGVEFFFRGFLLFPLYRVFGYHALLITAIPYVMIHFGKPMPETIGALVAGLVLGYLALRARSCLLGVGLHVGIAVTMDVLSLSRQAGSFSAFVAGLNGG